MRVKHKKILTMPVAVTSYVDVTKKVVIAAKELVANYICVANVHMCMEAFDNKMFSQVINSAFMVVPDGRPLVWSLNAIGEKEATQVRGADLMMHICDMAQKEIIPIGLYGGSIKSLNGLVLFLEKKFPALAIPFSVSPPFRPLTHTEDKNFIDEINISGVKILFVGLGCPKQEIWMAKHRETLSCVMIGVGAAFDFFSREKRHAPKWLQKIGLEWLFRLAIEPKRLCKRYLKHNPRFVWYFSKQLLGYNFDPKR